MVKTSNWVPDIVWVVEFKKGMRALARARARKSAIFGREQQFCLRHMYGAMR